MTWASLTVRHTESTTTHHHVEIHPIDANSRVILDAQINMLLDSKSKVALRGEVLFSQLVLADFETFLEYLLGLGSTHCAVDSYLLVTTNTKRSNSVACCGVGMMTLIAAHDG